MKWEVKIRHTEAEEWISLDLGDENPYITLQAFDVSEPSARNVTFSQALTLPVTETNIRAMQYFNGINGRYGDISDARVALPAPLRRAEIHRGGYAAVRRFHDQRGDKLPNHRCKQRLVRIYG